MYNFVDGRLFRTVAMIEAYTGPVRYNACVNLHVRKFAINVDIVV